MKQDYRVTLLWFVMQTHEVLLAHGLFSTSFSEESLKFKKEKEKLILKKHYL